MGPITWNPPAWRPAACRARRRWTCHGHGWRAGRSSRRAGLSGRGGP